MYIEPININRMTGVKRCMKYKFINWALLVLIVTQFSCVHMPPTEEKRSRFGKVGLVTARFTPDSNYHTFAKGYLAGAGKGFAAGAGTGAAAGALMSITPPFYPFNIILMPFLVAGGAVVGGTVGIIGGTTSAVSMSEAEKIETTIKGAFSSLNIQEKMGDHVLQKAQEETGHFITLIGAMGPASKNEDIDYRHLLERGIDTVLEIRVTKLGFHGGKGKSPSIGFFMDVRASLIRTDDNSVLFDSRFGYWGDKKGLERWIVDDGTPLQDEFQRAYNDIALRIVEDVFLVYDFPFKHSLVAAYLCGLKPITPRNEYGFWEHFWMVSDIPYQEIDSLQPTFQWEPYVYSRSVSEGDDFKKPIKRPENITYDLRIWRVENKSPVELDYSRTGLPDPIHKIEEALLPSSKYFWSVRVRADIDGKKRVSRWSSLKECPDSTQYRRGYQEPNYFHFVTPDAEIIISDFNREKIVEALTDRLSGMDYHLKSKKDNNQEIIFKKIVRITKEVVEGIDRMPTKHESSLKLTLLFKLIDSEPGIRVVGRLTAKEDEPLFNSNDEKQRIRTILEKMSSSSQTKD